MMKTFSSLFRPLRPKWLAAIFLVALAGSWMVTPSGFSQAPGAVASTAALSPFLAKLKAQQDQLAANQTKIEAQTAQLKEELRQAKIYAARTGAKR